MCRYLESVKIIGIQMKQEFKPVCLILELSHTKIQIFPVILRLQQSLGSVCPQQCLFGIALAWSRRRGDTTEDQTNNGL